MQSATVGRSFRNYEIQNILYHQEGEHLRITHKPTGKETVHGFVHHPGNGVDPTPERNTASTERSLKLEKEINGISLNGKVENSRLESILWGKNAVKSHKMSSPLKLYPTSLVRRPSQTSQGLVRRPTSCSGQIPLFPTSTPMTPLPLIRRRSQSLAHRPETPAYGEHPFIASSSPTKLSPSKGSTRAAIPMPHTPVSDSSTATSILKENNGKLVEPKTSRARRFKEEVFFAFVPLPLSCWYTRGGKRLGGDDDEGSEMRVPLDQREDVSVGIRGRAVT